MKKSIIVIRFFFLIIAGTNVQASVIVANQDIEEGFHDTITGPGISGFVYYDTGSKTLTLKNASISWSDAPVTI